MTDAEIAAKSLLTLDFLVTYLTNPFTIYNVDPSSDELEGERTMVVKSLVAGELTAAYGLGKGLQLGVALPVIFSMTGDGLDPATAMPGDSIQATGLGDLRAEVKAKLWEQGALRLAGAVGLTIPTSVGSGGGDYLGDDLPSGRGRVSLQWSNGKLSAGANLGFIARKPREIYSSTVGQQLIYGAAGAVQINDRVSGVAEFFGRLGSLDLDANPLELGAGIRFKATRSLSVLAGGGGGLVRGIGSPDARVFMSVGWARDRGDDDNDGLVNLKDRCPLLAEDRDGFDDEDGCPDEDNDGDLREDAEDKCPDRKEDIDGFEDDDGCPEYDNDKDGVKDVEDRCPTDAEDGKGADAFAKDGCPASKTDADGDSIMDDVDACIADAEDTDGFEEWDGCPEADNDRDGVADADDKCPVCGEDKDGTDDADGCPDPDVPSVAGANVTFDGDRLLFGEPLQFDSKKRLRKPSVNAVNQAAAIIKAHPEVTKWVILAAAPRGRDEEKAQAEAQRWANVIKAQLLINGVNSDIVDAVGAVSDEQRIGIVAKEKTEFDPSAVECPDSLKAVERPQPAPAAAAMPAETSASTPASSGTTPAATTPAATTPAATTPAATTPAATTPAATPPAATPADSKPAPDAAAGAVPDAFKELSGVVKAIEFKRNSTELEKGQSTLDKVAELLKANPNVVLEVGAHTDNRKSPDQSRTITQGQADRVVEYLVKHGVAVEQLKAVGHGLDKPIGDNKSSKGRETNRRIEFTFSVK